MKSYFLPGVIFLLLVVSASSKAQRPNIRAKLFNTSENKISYPKAELEKIFTKTNGSSFKLSLAGNFKFTGTIVSSVQRYSNLRSYLIRSGLPDGTMFVISRRTNDDNSVSYVGRIINEKYSDGYELRCDALGNYYLNKINMNDILQEKK